MCVSPLADAGKDAGQFPTPAAGGAIGTHNHPVGIKGARRGTLFNECR